MADPRPRVLLLGRSSTPRRTRVNKASTSRVFLVPVLRFRFSHFLVPVLRFRFNRS